MFSLKDENEKLTKELVFAQSRYERCLVEKEALSTELREIASSLISVCQELECVFDHNKQLCDEIDQKSINEKIAVDTVTCNLQAELSELRKTCFELEQNLYQSKEELLQKTQETLTISLENSNLKKALDDLQANLDDARQSCSKQSDDNLKIKQELGKVARKENTFYENFSDKYAKIVALILKFQSNYALLPKNRETFQNINHAFSNSVVDSAYANNRYCTNMVSNQSGTLSEGEIVSENLSRSPTRGSEYYKQKFLKSEKRCSHLKTRLNCLRQKLRKRSSSSRRHRSNSRDKVDHEQSSSVAASDGHSSRSRSATPPSGYRSRNGSRSSHRSKRRKNSKSKRVNKHRFSESSSWETASSRTPRSTFDKESPKQQTRHRSSNIDGYRWSVPSSTSEEEAGAPATSVLRDLVGAVSGNRETNGPHSIDQNPNLKRNSDVLFKTNAKKSPPTKLMFSRPLFPVSLIIIVRKRRPPNSSVTINGSNNDFTKFPGTFNRKPVQFKLQGGAKLKPAIDGRV